MMRIFITGDTHGNVYQEFHRFNDKNFLEGKILSSEDVIIIAGDFGLTWPNYKKNLKEQEYWKNWLCEKPWTTLFVDGNHEDHDYLQSLSTKKMYGGTVGIVRDKILHLKRGEIYTLNEKTFFCMGGATSIDKHQRIEGVDWFRGELPSQKELYYAMSNLEKHNNKVDYIIAHTLPANAIKVHMGRGKDKDILSHGDVYEDLIIRYEDPMAKFLQIVCERVQFDQYFCGHFHKDKTICNFNLLYNKIIEVF